MKITYSPAGLPPHVIDFDVDDLTSDEADRIEQAGGTQWDTYGGWIDQFNSAGWRAWRVALWVCLRREGRPDLAFEEFKPRPNEVAIEVPEVPVVAPVIEGKSETGDAGTDSQ